MKLVRIAKGGWEVLEKTPQEELALARLRREQYLAAKFRRELQILEEI
jgi:hypothetical protein